MRGTSVSDLAHAGKMHAQMQVLCVCVRPGTLQQTKTKSAADAVFVSIHLDGTDMIDRQALIHHPWTQMHDASCLDKVQSYALVVVDHCTILLLEMHEHDMAWHI